MSTKDTLENLELNHLEGLKNAHIVSLNSADKYLFSYSTPVAMYRYNSFYFKGAYSRTTTRHVCKFFEYAMGISLRLLLPKIKGCKTLSDIQDNVYCITHLIRGEYRITTNEDEVYIINIFN